MLPLVYVHCGPVVDFFIITKQTSLHPFDFVRNLFHLLLKKHARDPASREGKHAYVAKSSSSSMQLDIAPR